MDTMQDLTEEEVLERSAGYGNGWIEKIMPLCFSIVAVGVKVRGIVFRT